MVASACQMVKVAPPASVYQAIQAQDASRLRLAPRVHAKMVETVCRLDMAIDVIALQAILVSIANQVSVCFFNIFLMLVFYCSVDLTFNHKNMYPYI